MARIDERLQHGGWNPDLEKRWKLPQTAGGVAIGRYHASLVKSAEGEWLIERIDLYPQRSKQSKIDCRSDVVSNGLGRKRAGVESSGTERIGDWNAAGNSDRNRLSEDWRE